MKAEVYATIQFSLPADRRPAGPFFAQAKTAHDGADHPFGQWSLAVRPTAEYITGSVPAAMPALVTFVAEEAPHDVLKETKEIELFFGVVRIGSLLCGW